jgi:broad specificity phosphatase PhoE
MTIWNTIRELPTDRPAAVIMRHAERHPIDVPADVEGAALTADGLVASADAGRRLTTSRGVRFYHSPVRRCRQTAEQMAAGLCGAGGTGSMAGPVAALGPTYVRDWQAAFDVCGPIGTPAFLRAWFDGALPDRMVEPAPVAAHRNYAAVHRVLERETAPALLVFVTHDWNITLVREYYLGIRHEDVGLPGYLEGLVVFHDHDHWVYRDGGRTGDVRAVPG